METITKKELENCKVCMSFFSNPDCSGMCSKCFKDTAVSEPKENKQNIQKIEELVFEDKKIEEIDPKKCAVCKRKTGIRGIICKCSFNFCMKHRLPEEHECGFDYKTAGKNLLETANPNITKAKLDSF